MTHPVERRFGARVDRFLFAAVDVPLFQVGTDEFDRLHAAATQKRHAHTIERDALRNERGNSCKPTTPEPSPSLPSKPSKTAPVSVGPGSTSRSNPHHRVRASQSHLEHWLALAGDCHKLYKSMDDSLRRICNHAFEKFWVKKDSDTVEGEPGQPFNVLFNPEVHTLALNHEVH